MCSYIFYIFFLIITGIKATNQDNGECKPVGTKWSEGNTTYWALEYKNEIYAYPTCEDSSFFKVRCVDGKWEKPLTRCEKISTRQCETLTTLNNVAKTCTQGSSVGSECTLRCVNKGYQLTGSNRRRCQENLQWSGKPSRCDRNTNSVSTTARQCETISTLNNVVKTCTHGSSVGSVCTLRCVNKGYQLTGSNRRRCQENLKWSGEPSQCNPNSNSGKQKQQVATKNQRKKVPSLTRTMVGVDSCRINNGGCQHKCNSTLGHVVCSCYKGFQPSSNNKCIDIDECATNNGGCSDICSNKIGSYQCSCSNGYRLHNNRKNCIDIDECATNNGGCSTECTNLSGSYYCSCPYGYRWDVSEKKCVDIDECQERRYNCDQTCHNTPGSYICSCEQGYKLYEGYICGDIDECAVSNGGCSNRCYNTPGSYSCFCERGYRLDENRTSCVDIDECQEGQHYCQHKCHNTPGSYTCTCEDGFLLNYLNQCEDVNECDLNNGGCSDICVNSIGSYYCSCKKGHNLDLDGKNCKDINECLHKEHNRCNQKCINTMGSYICSCEPGYILKNKYECEGCRKNSYKSAQDVSCVECPPNSVTDSEAKTSISDCFCLPGFDGNPSLNLPCNDIDECLSNNYGCSHKCVNTPGGVFCSCPLGFQLKADKKTCEDIDECSLKNGGCQMHCENSVGSFSCSCSIGYTLSEDKHSCIDINECAKNNGGCSDTCNNFLGGYYCSCPKDYHLDVEGKTCVGIRCPRVAVPHYSRVECSEKSSAMFLKDKQILKSNDENSSSPLYFSVGTVCKVKCNRGYALTSSYSAIQCLNSGRWNSSTPQCVVSHCTPLKVPENGDIYPEECTEGPISVRQKCYVTCKSGYHISDQKKELMCKNNLTWTTDTPSCEPDNIVPVISCPNDISVDLMINENYANVTIPRPEANMEDLEIYPDWIILNKAISFPVGKTDVLLRVRSSTTNATAECVMTVNVIDKEPPIFLQCPESFDINGVGLLGTPVNWDEPFVVDNVGIQSVSTNLEPNSTLTAGIHYVEYIARDDAGNIAQCSFQISITSAQCEYLGDPENGKANCMEWLMGVLCRPSCDPGFERDSNEPQFFACGDSGLWTPSDSISPCLAVVEETV